MFQSFAHMPSVGSLFGSMAWQDFSTALRRDDQVMRKGSRKASNGLQPSHLSSSSAYGDWNEWYIPKHGALSVALASGELQIVSELLLWGWRNCRKSMAVLTRAQVGSRTEDKGKEDEGVGGGTHERERAWKREGRERNERGATPFFTTQTTFRGRGDEGEARERRLAWCHDSSCPLAQLERVALHVWTSKECLVKDKGGEREGTSQMIEEESAEARLFTLLILSCGSIEKYPSSLCPDDSMRDTATSFKDTVASSIPDSASSPEPSRGRDDVNMARRAEEKMREGALNPVEIAIELSVTCAKEANKITRDRRAKRRCVLLVGPITACEHHAARIAALSPRITASNPSSLHQLGHQVSPHLHHPQEVTRLIPPRPPPPPPNTCSTHAEPPYNARR